jgi:hypothetical protein
MPGTQSGIVNDSPPNVEFHTSAIVLMMRVHTPSMVLR